MPKLRNLAALAAAVEAGRRYARNNPEQTGRYVDQAAAFLDKQTKGRYSGQIDGVVSKVKSVAGLPPAPRTQGFSANAGYGRHEGYGAPVPPPVTPTTTAATTAGPATPASPSATVPPTSSTVDPEQTGESHFPGSKDV